MGRGFLLASRSAKLEYPQPGKHLQKGPVNLTNPLVYHETDTVYANCVWYPKRGDQLWSACFSKPRFLLPDRFPPSQPQALNPACLPFRTNRRKNKILISAHGFSGLPLAPMPAHARACPRMPAHARADSAHLGAGRSPAWGARADASAPPAAGRW